MSVIKFGTDGWRGVIARDFTFENLEIVAAATADYYIRHPKIKNGLVVGYDARFLSREFAECVSTVLANKGILVHLAKEIVSTPMVATAILKYNSAGGVMITASHNPPIYNGFKLKADYGGPAREEEIKGVEKLLLTAAQNYKNTEKKDFTELINLKQINLVDFRSIYFENIKDKIDFDKIKKSKLKILYDPMYGSGHGILDDIFPNMTKIHNEFNPSFHSVSPEPLPQNCHDTIEKIIDGGFDLGIVTDGDADRIGTIDEKGNFVSTQLLFPIFLKYLHQKKGLSGKVVKTVSVSSLVERMCAKYNIPLFETPVGFKYITEHMVKDDILIGGEESGGIGMNSHIPERDGIFNGLLLCEILIDRNQSLNFLVEEIYSEFGRTYYDRIDFHTTKEIKENILRKCEIGLETISGFKVNEIQKVDGYKCIFDDSWLLIRPSGTEPVIRFYAESEDEAKVQILLNAAVNLQ
jgi:alpha-D-glucose phosphate-specific phosphoglucomutase